MKKPVECQKKPFNVGNIFFSLRKLGVDPVSAELLPTYNVL